MHRLAVNQYLARRLLISVDCARFRGIVQIYLPGEHGDDHDDGTDAAGPGHKLKVSCHGNRTG